MRRRSALASIGGISGLALWLAAPTIQAANALSPQDLKLLSLEELLDVRVTSVSRKEQQLRDAPAAIAVIDSEAIRRSGATTLPETFRLIPGLHVAQNNASAWAISSRGFSSVNSEKLLVLTDSRSIYTPLFSGVFWDAQDYLLEDIERIEVIRGPGATQWGSNAVNGVINILTKSARDTQGTFVEAGRGEELHGLFGARIGTQFAPDGYFRVYAKYTDHDRTFNPDTASDDDWNMARFGMRADWDLTERDTLTVQGGMYRGEVGLLAPSVVVADRPGPSGELETDLSGGHLSSRWRRALDVGSELQLRVYYDRTHRDDPSFDDRLDTFDLDFQHHFALADRHEVVWGLNYRFMDNDNEGKGIFALAPQSAQDELFSAFVQDEIALRHSFRVTIGSKLEHNDFSGFEVQPSLRLAWTAAPAHTLWAAVSRAMRVPTRIERDVAIDATDPAVSPVLRLVGNDDFAAEELLAYELGHRWQVLDSLFIDTAAFYNRYDGLATLELGTPFVEAPGRVVVPLENRNRMDGSTRGIETLITYSPHERWRVSATYAHIDLDLDPQGLDLNRARFLAGATPKHQFGLRSYLDLPAHLQLDVHWRHSSDIERLPTIPAGTGIDGYSELDVRVAWRGWESLELSLVGRNLLHRRHAEFVTPGSSGQIERSVYGKVAWSF